MIDLSSVFGYTEVELKQKVASIIKTYRSISIYESDIKINSLKRTSANDYILTGEYTYRNMFNNSIYEKGTFTMTLGAKNLDQIEVTITPKS